MAFRSVLNKRMKGEIQLSSCSCVGSNIHQNGGLQHFFVNYYNEDKEKDVVLGLLCSKNVYSYYYMRLIPIISSR